MINRTKNSVLKPISAMILIFAACALSPERIDAGEEMRADILVYGATPAGIAAAIAAGKSGKTALLVEPTRRIGGLVTNGLSHTDFRTFESLTGTFLDFMRGVQGYYEEKYGKDSPQARACFRGTFAEPHVNLAVFERMLAQQPNVCVLKQHRLASVETKGGELKRISAAAFTGPDGQNVSVPAAVFIDATYEGDLMAMAGVKYRVGREGRAEHGEELAPETADAQLQGYNFRFTMTRKPENRVGPVAPPGYQRGDFLALLPLLQTGQLKSVFCSPAGGVYKYQPPALPNDKFDINDVSKGLVRLSLPGENGGWPEGGAAERRRIFEVHLRHDIGMLYFLQNDEAVPETFRKEAREWGLCKDEFIENGNLPEQLYIREARRMRGMYCFTEKDAGHAAGDARGVLQTTAIAMGDYGPNCHGTAHEGPRIGGRHTGEFYKPNPPYQIPYGVLAPLDCENLLVAVACSASHAGFCALRLEPIWTSLGQAAGHAACVAQAEKLPVQRVPVARVQRLLHAEGSATIYISDVPPGAPDFAAVQWWGTRGGLHGLAPQPAKLGPRGANITGQYYQAFPGHAAELDKPLDETLAARWRGLAQYLGVAPENLAGLKTRGEFIRRAYELAKKE